MARHVYDFSQGSADMRALLGGKGANLAEMTAIGLPVPDGFTITTEACVSYMRAGGERPAGLDDEIAEHLAALESRTGKRRPPCALRSTTFPPRAIAAAIRSADGSACAMEPAIVPRLRTCTSPIEAAAAERRPT